MRLFRGTPEPEAFPKLRYHPCIFFALKYEWVVDFATGGEQEPKGYVQEYKAPDTLNIYDQDKNPSLLKRFFGRLSESEAREIAYWPPREWVSFLRNSGFDGYAGFDYICLWNLAGLKLKKRWRLDYSEGRRDYERTLVHQSADR